ncbi:MAG: transcription antitermination factor NusB [Candidatus Eisenbacteria bacterium]
MNRPGRRTTTARSLALELLLEFERDPFPLTSALEQQEERLSDPRERHLLHTLVLETLRHRTRLDFVVSKFLRKGTVDDLPARTRNILRIGAVQILLLDRIPPHAAVSTAVDLAHAKHGAGLPPLVNAILRKLVREGRSRWDELDRTVRPNLASRYSHPQWLVERWTGRWGRERTEAMLRWNSVAPDYWLRLAPGAAPPPDATPGWIPGTARWPAGSRPELSEEFRAGALTVQDGSAILVGCLPPCVHGLVLDCCAAPGTKLSHLNERAESGTTLIGLDLSWGRLARLRAGLGRHRNVEGVRIGIVNADATRLPLRPPWQGVVIDAPCSNLGVLRRRVDARWRVQSEDPAELAELQSRLLEAAAHGLEPGGWLVYSVCTIEPEETILQRRSFLERHSDWTPIPSPEFVPQEARLEPGEILLLPGEHETDGTYAFAVRKPQTSGS